MIGLVLLLIGAAVFIGYRWWFASPDGPVVGPTYARADDTYHMDLEGFPIAFDAPGNWSCLRDDPDESAGKEQQNERRSGQTTSMLCAAMGDGASSPENPAGGRIQVDGCDVAGSTGDRAAKNEPDSAWERIDADTRYAEWTAQTENGERTFVALLRGFATSGGRPDSYIGATPSAEPGQQELLQKLVNELYTRTS